MSERTELTGAIEEILRNRTYDRHAYDQETFEELLHDIDEAVRADVDARRRRAIEGRADELQSTYPDWRRGQALFNALHEIYPALADQIRGTLADPFYQDSPERLQAFEAAVMAGVR